MVPAFLVQCRPTTGVPGVGRLTLDRESVYSVRANRENHKLTLSRIGTRPANAIECFDGVVTLMPLFRQSPDRREYDEVQRQIGHLEDEIAILSGLQRDQEVAGAATSSVDRSLKHLRASLAGTELVSKREQLQALQERRTQLLSRNPDLAKPLPPPKPPSQNDRRRTVIVLSIVAITIAAAGAAATGKLRVQPSIRSSVTMIAPTIQQRVTQRGEQFYSQAFNIVYEGGTVTISGDPAPTGTFSVDDRIALSVARPDKTTATWEHLFNEDCQSNRPDQPEDLTSLFQIGVNVVTVSLYDVCGTAEGTLGPVLLSVH